jgi:hypothetical protein
MVHFYVLKEAVEFHRKLIALGYKARITNRGESGRSRSDRPSTQVFWTVTWEYRR